MPKRMTELSDIIARLERATGPDRELDIRLWAEFDGRDLRTTDQGQFLAKRRRAPFDECSVGSFWNGQTFAEIYVPRATLSLDVAVALLTRVLPGYRGDIDLCPFEPGDPCGARLFPPSSIMNIAGEAATPALALCIAICRAVEKRNIDAETGNV